MQSCHPTGVFCYMPKYEQVTWCFLGAAPVAGMQHRVQHSLKEKRIPHPLADYDIHLQAANLGHSEPV